MLKEYYRLTKPGIVYGNVFTTLAAFLFASTWHVAPLLFFATLVGIALVIASACVFNNYIDRDIDTHMARTRDRALATRRIPARSALIFATVLGIIGFFLLYKYVNILTFELALVGFIFYVVLYGYSKRRSHWGTVVGSVSGAIPIVVGYTGATGRFDVEALILFFVLVCWQMPHFYAITLYRFDDYAAAKIPVLPVQKGIRTTKIHMLLYVIAYLLAISSLYIFGYAGHIYLALVGIIGLIWLWKAVQGFSAPDDAKWGRKFFLFSLIVLVSFSIILAVSPLLPY